MATPKWAPPRKDGESDKSYKSRYYTAQRVHAEKTGDTKTLDRIKAKAPKPKSKPADSDSAKFNTAMNKGAQKVGRALNTSSSDFQSAMSKGAGSLWKAATTAPGDDPKVQAEVRRRKKAETN